jgi:hypothetical protein
MKHPWIDSIWIITLAFAAAATIYLAMTGRLGGPPEMPVAVAVIVLLWCSGLVLRVFVLDRRRRKKAHDE